ncbi:anaerobic sulfatase maturase [candidate division KSB1 bacterium]
MSLPPDLSVLIKATSARCNLACDYCFYYDRASDPYQDVEKALMPDDVLAAMVEQVTSASRNVASFCWQGGEPLLTGLDFFRQAVEYQKQFGRPGQSIANSIQTNGLLIDRDWVSFLLEYKVFVGLSLDGPAEIHDRHRFTLGNKPSHELVMKGLNLLKQERVEFNILAVVSRESQSYARETYRWFRSLGLEFLQFIPCIELDPGSGLAPFSVTPKGYGRFLCDLFDEWYNDGYPVASIRLFEDILAAFSGITPFTCEFRPSCGDYLVVEYNGDVYPCDFMVESEWLLGNILETTLTEMSESDRFNEFLKLKPRTPNTCADCQWNFVCHNGCPRQRRMTSGFERESILCRAYKMLYEHSADRFQRLADRLAGERQAQSAFRI